MLDGGAELGVFHGHEELALPQLTVLENIELPLLYAGWAEDDGAERAHELAEQVGLGHRVGHRPTEMSGGERQRVAIARALLAEPRVVLADEPTGNLDSQTAAGVVELMFSIQRERGLAFLLVTHDEGLARRCDRVVRMKDGAVVTEEQVG